MEVSSIHLRGDSPLSVKESPNAMIAEYEVLLCRAQLGVASAAVDAKRIIVTAARKVDVKPNISKETNVTATTA